MELKVTHCLYQVIDRHELKYRFSIVCMRKSDRPDTRNIAELKAVQCIRLGDELRMFYVTVAKRREYAISFAIECNYNDGPLHRVRKSD